MNELARLIILFEVVRAYATFCLASFHAFVFERGREFVLLGSCG
jgi:hypothetical protein